MFSNKSKIEVLDKIFVDYKILLEQFIKDILSGKLEHKPNLDHNLLDNDYFHSSGWKQVCYKNASEIVTKNLSFKKKEIYNKYKKIYFYFKQRNRQIKFLNKYFQELNINYYKRLKINIHKVSITLDYRLFNISKETTFDEFLCIYTPYSDPNYKRKHTCIKCPIKYYDYMKPYLNNWNRKKSIQLVKSNNKYLVKIFWEKESPIKKPIINRLGVDLGYHKLITCSNRKIYGDKLEDIYIKLANKVRGSKSYKKLITFKNNEVNRICNQFISENNVDELFVEDLKNVKLNKRFGMNKVQYWTYSLTIQKLERLSNDKGFTLTKVNPSYTSQICSRCGNLDKSSRNGEHYKCSSCGYEIDADINAAINIYSRGLNILPLISSSILL